MKLTDSQVRQIRASGLTDNYWAQRLWVTSTTIRTARTGVRYQHVAALPDRAPREGTGSTHAIRQGLPQPARPKRYRRQWL